MHTLALPGDAHNVRIRAWACTDLPDMPLLEAINITEPAPTGKTYRITGWARKPDNEVIQE